MKKAVSVKRIPPKDWSDAPRYILLDDYVSDVGVTVPQGFVTDGISIPKMFHWLTSPAGMGFNAALVHDYLLFKETPWAEALDYFNKQLKADDVPFILRKLMTSGVWAWGKLAGKK